MPPPIIRVGDVWLWSTKGPHRDQSCIRLEDARRRLWIWSFPALLKTEWRQDGGNAFRQHGLAEPGGPIIRMLCPPAQATSSARLAVCWPGHPENPTPPNYGHHFSVSAVFHEMGLAPLGELIQAHHVGAKTSPVDIHAAHHRCFCAFTFGTIRFVIFLVRAEMAIGKRRGRRAHRPVQARVLRPSHIRECLFC